MILLTPLFRARRAAASGCAFAILATGRLLADNVTLTAADAQGSSSFNSAGHWSNAAAPSAGNTYSTNGFQLRTPPDANSYTFGGSSLTVTTGSRFLFKGTGTAQVLTVSNLILAGGLMDQANSANSNAVTSLTGNINVAANTIVGALTTETLNINAQVTGTGMLTVGGAGINNGGDNGTVLFGLSNSGFSGGLTLSGTGTLTLAADLAGGTGNITLNSGTLRLTTGRTNNYLADSATLSLTGSSAANLDFSGTDRVGSLVLNGVTQAAGTYNATTNPGVFTGTGSLIVGVPEPSTTVGLALAALLGVLGWKKRRTC